LAGNEGQNQVIAKNALGYVELLREHIAKEDDILYPLAERLIPDAARDAVIAGYGAAEAQTADDLEKRYLEVVVSYEAETLGNAA
jgi:hemerythrin-like domain-containing protein